LNEALAPVNAEHGFLAGFRRLGPVAHPDSASRFTCPLRFRPLGRKQRYSKPFRRTIAALP